MESMMFYFVCFLLLIVLVVTLLVIRWYFIKELNGMKLDLLKTSSRDVLPIKIQAIERLTLLLERITPDSMLLREQVNATTNLNLQSLLLGSIRREFEHNQSMQIYVSSETWDKIRIAKEELVKVINLSASEVNPNNPSLELSKVILERFSYLSSNHFSRAIEALRNEIVQISNI